MSWFTWKRMESSDLLCKEDHTQKELLSFVRGVCGGRSLYGTRVGPMTCVALVGVPALEAVKSSSFRPQNNLGRLGSVRGRGRQRILGMVQLGDKQGAGFHFRLTSCPERELICERAGVRVCWAGGHSSTSATLPNSSVLTWCSSCAPMPSVSARTTPLKCLSAKPFRRPVVTSRPGCTCSMRIDSRWGPASLG